VQILREEDIHTCYMRIAECQQRLYKQLAMSRDDRSKKLQVECNVLAT
jgi:hypothetical protein